MDKKALSCVREESKKILLNAYNNGIYSAACLALSGSDGVRSKNCFSNVGEHGGKTPQQVDKNSIFDLASLTKPLVTLPTILHLIEKGKISWTEPLSSLLEIPVPAGFEKVDLGLLLSHRAGFCAHHDYWKELLKTEDGQRKSWVIERILNDKPAYEPGSQYLYSDLGYILLGFVVETKSGLPLDELWNKCIAEPLGVEDMLFFSNQVDQKRRNKTVSTGSCRWSGKPLAGRVHDDNCRAMGGVAGHAGLFGSGGGVLAMCNFYVDTYHGRSSERLFSTRTFRTACLPAGDSNNAEWTYGFNRPSATGSSSGSSFSSESIGHLGFTGVSFWIDLSRQLSICLLTNRVIKGEDREGIKKLRPELHDAVMNCLGHGNSPRTNPGAECL